MSLVKFVGQSSQFLHSRLLSRKQFAAGFVDGGKKQTKPPKTSTSKCLKII